MAVTVLYLLLSALVLAAAKPRTTEWDARSPPERRNARVVDGYDAGVGQFPHQALVLCDGSSICGGALITRTAVLTRARCIDYHTSWTVRLGGIHRTQEERTAWIEVATWAVVHPNYNTTAYLSDNVAILFLPAEAPLNSFINVVALPSFLEVNETFAGQIAVVSGWGQTNTSATCCPEVLQWTEVTVIPNSACTQYYEPGRIIGSTLCAGNEYTGMCPGDYGSALVIKSGEGYKAIGVTSFVPDGGCGTAGAPAAYTRVTSVLDWITTTAGISAK
ncbi:brachyurin-like [Schistocerca nitens]|uniref:brachyurin-like n=1 Tax=Schistocerca nitens TaxID=7011 RepID=UPI00211912F7|nr:brachyurin-like [Schistocerca nitens]